MFYIGSQLDAQEGIRFRGHTIPEMARILPKVESEMIPEGVLWLLLTGDAPNAEELAEIQHELLTDKPLPKSTHDLIYNYGKSHHPMTMLSMAILDLQKNSKFAEGYAKNTLKKSDYWKATLEDGLYLLRYLPKISAAIYTTKYNKHALKPTANDWAGRYSESLGFKSKAMAETLRGYLSIHTDHEGGNVSAHTSWLVNSALADPFLSTSAAMNGLAGPLHGLANQEVLKFLLTMKESINAKGVKIVESNDPVLLNAIREFADDWLKSNVIPGYGHAKLRNTDPRFTFLKEQALKYMPEKELVKLVHACEQVVPEVLKKLGKVKNPYPNVDAHSGVMLYELGLTEFDYYTVVFGVSRAIGCVSNMVWARALGLAIERPGSLTLEKLEEIANQK
jgi:citrate synthase